MAHLINAALQQPVASTHMQGAPLPSAPGAPCDRDFQKLYAAWFNRVIYSHYPVASDPKGAAFLKAELTFLSEDHSYGSTPDLVAQARSFDVQSVTEPALLMGIGMIEPDMTKSLAALDKALTLLPASQYPKFVWFIAAANAGRDASLMNCPAAERKTRDTLSLNYLAQGLADDSFRPDEMPVLRWRLDMRSTTNLMDRHFNGVVNTVQASPKVDPWLKEYMEGVRYVSAAWVARGSGWADTVSQQGWRDFAADLALARTHLVHSWQLNPHDPAAAAEMITVCMGESEETDTMRTWFDRAVAADFDFMQAYYSICWGLRPRWLGNFAEMRAFGEECAATNRYDTMVPEQLVEIAIATSVDSDNHSEPFQDPQLGGQVLDILDKYLWTPEPLIEPQYYHTLAAIVADKLGRPEEVRIHLAAINFQPDTDDYLSGLDNLQALVKQAQETPPQ